MEQTLNLTDTIVATATAAGRGAIAMVRLSGPQALYIAQRAWKGSPLTEAGSHTAHLGYVVNPQDGRTLDQALATVFRAPATFTGEDMVEFGLHGSPLIVRSVLEALTQCGARPAGPGEFSQRAVANGRMSLTAAEAAADLVAASSRAAMRIALSQMRGGVDQSLKRMQEELLRLASLLELELDFSEEDVEFADRSALLATALEARKYLKRAYDSFSTGEAIKEGIPVAIAGPTNAGKSSLLNALTGDDRAIVSDIHGTTRDIVEDTITVGDYLFRFMDTAGLRDSSDPIERIGIERSRKAISRASIVLLVTDGTAPLPADLIQETRDSMPEGSRLIVLRNKADADAFLQKGIDCDAISISAKSGKGLDKLKELLRQTAAEAETAAGDILLTNARHRDCMAQALEALDTAIAYLSPDSTSPPVTPDIIAQAVRAVTAPLSDLTGDTLRTPALLKHIFSHFCIGK